jgi:hypothetical protein
MKKQLNTSVTKAGYPTKDVKWNNTANLYLGLVKDPLFNNEFITCSWKKSGKCVNATRPELNLIAS